MRTEFIRGQLAQNPWLLSNDPPPLQAGDFYFYNGHVGKVSDTQKQGTCLECHSPMQIDGFTRPSIKGALIDGCAFVVCAICEREMKGDHRAVPLRVDGELKPAIALVCSKCAVEYGQVPIRSAEYID